MRILVRVIVIVIELIEVTSNMSMVAGYKFNDYIKHNIFLDIIAYGLIILFVPLFYGLVL